MSNWETLRRLLLERAVRHSDDPFSLASGGLSNFYIELDQVLYDSIGFQLVAEVLGPALWWMMGEGVNAVGGPVLGSVMLTAALMHNAVNNKRTLHSFAVRKDGKEHGGKEHISGILVPGDRVVICEDLCTTGGSALYAKDAAEAAGAIVIGILSIVDRGARVALKDHNYRFMYATYDLGVPDDVR
jgi:orotate phosphoribosyltransferase